MTAQSLLCENTQTTIVNYMFDFKSVFGNSLENCVAFLNLCHL